MPPFWFPSTSLHFLRRTRIRFFTPLAFQPKLLSGPRPLLTLLFLALAISYFAKPVRAAPIQHSTNNDSNTQCVNATWEQIVLFILLNYVTHAMTVRSDPGETQLVTAFSAFAALLMPFSGVFRGARGLLFAARWAGNKLAMARSAQALCMVSRSESWSPRKNEEVRGCIVRGGKKAGQQRAQITVATDFFHTNSSTCLVLTFTVRSHYLKATCLCTLTFAV